MVEATLPSTIASPLSPWVTMTREGPVVRVALHPAAPDIRFGTSPDGRLRVKADTALAGPGYHAYLVSLLDRLAETVGCAWVAGEDGELVGDATGYWAHRDLGRLQELYASWCVAAGQGLRGRGRTHLGLPDGLWPVARDGALCTALGPMALQTVDRLLSGAEPERRALAATLFPWWDPALDGRFWRAYGDVLGWCALRWCPPADEAEETDLRRTAAAWDLAGGCEEPGPEDDSTGPRAVLAELLRTPRVDAVAPRPEGMGYARGEVWVGVGDRWPVRMPGYLYADADLATSVHTFGRRSVRTTPYAAPGTSASAWLDAFGQQLREAAAEGEAGEMLSFDEGEGGRSGRARIHRVPDDGGYWMLSGAVAVQGHLLAVSVCWGADAERAWAERVWRSPRRG